MKSLGLWGHILRFVLACKRQAPTQFAPCFRNVVASELNSFKG